MSERQDTDKEASREWLHVGAKVATLRSDDWRTNIHRPTFATVARIGKRDVVLDDDQRFNVHRLDRREGGTWGWVVRLLPADDPVVVEALETWRDQQKVARAKTAAENWRYGRDGTQPVDVILALAALTGVEDEICALFDRPFTPDESHTIARCGDSSGSVDTDTGASAGGRQNGAERFEREA